jgi:hypothetical protein
VTGAVAAPAQPLYLADHPLLYAVPVLIPAFVIVAIVALVVVRDRRRKDDGDD